MPKSVNFVGCGKKRKLVDRLIVWYAELQMDQVLVVLVLKG